MFQKDFDSTGNIKEFAIWAADFLDNLPVGMYRTTLEGELVFCNWAFAFLLGYNEASNLQDFKVVELFPHKSERGKFVREVLDQGKVQHYDMQLVKKNGEYLACSTTARAVLNDDGQVTFIDGIMSETHNLDLNTSIPANPLESSDSYPVYIRVDSSGTIENLNTSASELLGYRAENSPAPSTLFSHIASESTDKLTHFLHSVQLHELSLDILPILDSQGIAHQMECQAFAVSLHDEQKKIDIYCRDISSTVESMQQSQTQERLQGVVEMAGGIAHNMNQPLTVINNLLYDLASGFSQENSEMQDKLARIQHQLDKLNSIAKKVRSVKQYKSIHYILGEKIIDIDQLS
jgi:PAS domain S-box-containing protein